MISGPRLFARFAEPPNSLGFCGPESDAIADLLPEGEDADRALAEAAPGFDGAWPYLELIGERTGHDALSPEVVGAYWLGNGLLQQVDIEDWGTALRDRFRDRSGSSWQHIEAAVSAGGLPHHSFHVYCVYPWVGLLREGVVEPSLEVLNQCRIRIGRVAVSGDGRSRVVWRPLEWKARRLQVGEEVEGWFQNPLDPLTPTLPPGVLVALHWDRICGVLNGSAGRRLATVDRLHMGIANWTAPS